MLAKWLQILPVFIYKRIAVKYCEQFDLAGVKVVTASKDVLIQIPKEK